jgi:ubiquinone/menaquinone biosynthesis C-methylase UbiE
MVNYENKYKQVVIDKYSSYDEESRLIATRHGQLEYFTTMHYIHQYLTKGMKILEIGAGTGRYSIALAKEGYDVTAIELVEHNLDILKENAKGIENLKAIQGDALDLSLFADNTFDLVLVLGPMYHLYKKKDQHQAIKEAIRVAKKNALIFIAYLTDGSIILDYGTKGHLKSLLKREMNQDYTLKQLPKEIFASFTIDNFQALFAKTKTSKLVQVTTDSILSICEKNSEFKVSDEEFELFKKWHLAHCEKLEMQGISHHLLYICRKD